MATDNGDSYVYAGMFFGVSFLIATLVVQIVRLGLRGLITVAKVRRTLCDLMASLSDRARVLKS
jgi:hypothetical protein